MLHSGLRGEITETVILVGSFSPGSVVILPNPLALHQLRPKPRRLVNATFGLHLEQRMFRQQYVRRARLVLLVLLLLATGVMGLSAEPIPIASLVAQLHGGDTISRGRVLGIRLDLLPPAHQVGSADRR